MKNIEQNEKLNISEVAKQQLLEDNDLTPEGDSDIIAFKGCSGGC